MTATAPPDQDGTTRAVTGLNTYAHCDWEPELKVTSARPTPVATVAATMSAAAAARRRLIL
jgi:hypothetical protein